LIGPRSPERLESGRFDLAVIGGGVLGAFVAWDASLRGYRTALIERDDFACGTTSASGRVLHGGLRSLQHLEFRTAAESLRERETLSRLAPGLSAPLTFLFPAERAGESVLFRGAALAWRGFTALREDGLPPSRFSGLRSGLPDALRAWAPRGGLVVHDRQLISPERLVLGVLAAAVDEGAVVVNRIEATEILAGGGRVAGVRIRDRVAQRDSELLADRVVNVAGPWAPDLWPARSGVPPAMSLARGVHVVADIPPPPVALGLPWREQDAGGRIRRPRRVFVMPWAGTTLIGASWDPTTSAPPAPLLPKAAEVRRFVDSVADQWPDLGLDRSRVRHAVVGLYPCFGHRRLAPDSFQVSRHPWSVDHRDHGGPEGCITAVGVKLTTARAVAERILDRFEAGEARTAAGGLTATHAPLESATPSAIAELGFEAVTDPRVAVALARSAVENEQALSLADLFLRRSVAGQFGVPGRDVLEAAAGELSRALAWPAGRVATEVREYENRYLRLVTEPTETGGSS
jgi:glycerol-3-phosphate dehydrogenase